MKLDLIILLLALPILTISQSQNCQTDDECKERFGLNYVCANNTCVPNQTASPSPGTYIVVPPTESPETTQGQNPPAVSIEQGCIESDNGKDYYRRGSTEASLGTGAKTEYTDFCFLNTSITDNNIFTDTLNEYYCENDILKSEEYDCNKENKVCRDGECVEKDPVQFNVYEGIFKEGGKYYRGLDPEKNKQSYFVDRTVADQDPLECKFTTTERIDTSKISFRVYDEFKNSVHLEPTTLNCRGTECKVVVEPFTFPRGIERSYGYEDLNSITKSPLKLPKTNSVKCEVTYKNNIYTSEPLNIANHLYIFIPFYPPYTTNLEEQYQYYIARTYLDEKTAKPIYLSDQKGCGYSDEELFEMSGTKEKIKERLEKQTQYKTVNNELVRENGELIEVHLNTKEEIENIIQNLTFENSVGDMELFLRDFAKDCLIRFGNKWKSKYDFVITLIGLFGSSFHPNSIATINLDNDSLTSDTIAHELGHAIANLDEGYVYLDNERQFAMLLSKGAIGGRNSDPYPSCCIDSPDNPKIGKAVEDIKGLDLDFYEEEKELIKLCTDIGGVCESERTICEKSNQFVIRYMGQSLRDQDPLCWILDDDGSGASGGACCLSGEKVKLIGNNCYPSNLEIPLEPMSCAGQPLNQDGSFVSNLETPWRSMMGYYKYPDDYKIYPQNVPYPLKPGLPKAG